MYFRIVKSRLFSHLDLLLLHDPLVFVEASLMIDLFLELVDRVATHYVHLVVNMITELLLWISQLRLILGQIHVCIDGKIA